MSIAAPRHIVVVGGGLAGVAAIEALRAAGYEGRIRLLSDETELPYDRPPLSKAFLGGTCVLSDMLLHGESWYREQRVECELGARVTALDMAHRRVHLKSALHMGYDKLLIATGARARLVEGLPEGGASRACYLRTVADASLIKASVTQGTHVVLLGGGVIGLETAATLAQAGCRVTVLEAGERIMGRFFPHALSGVVSELHIHRGVTIKLGVAVQRFKATASGWSIQLRDGSVVTADFMVIGIGVVPNSELAAAAGLPIRLQGVEVDVHAQTAAPGVYAAGDVATFPMRDGRWSRWENWTHARLHAATAARHMMGMEGSGYAEIPWVWSDQHEFNIQVTGSAVAERLILRGSMEAGRLTAFHLAGDRIVGATTINDSRNKSAIRRLIEHSARVAPEQLADVSLDLKKLAADVLRDASRGSPQVSAIST